MGRMGMVFISLLGYRSDSGFHLKSWGLCRLVAAGWVLAPGKNDGIFPVLERGILIL